MLRKKSYQINILNIKYSDNEQNKATITYTEKNRKNNLEYTITQFMVKTSAGWKILYP
jgi:hypothetical protein